MSLLDHSFSRADLHIGGAIDPHQAISAERILATLQGGWQQLSHGQTFTGRPATRLIVHDGYVFKWRSEFVLHEQASSRWLEQTLNRERALGVYHPARTWFKLHGAQQVYICNITPQLRPLHTLIKGLARADLIAILRQLLQHYFRLVAEQEVRLDEGLSNFALGQADSQLYYLDDDLYRWDKGIGLGQAIGVWIRQMHWLEDSNAELIGEALRDALFEHLKDGHWIDVFTRHLRELFLNSLQEGRRDAVLRGLQRPRPAPAQISSTSATALPTSAAVAAQPQQPPLAVRNEPLQGARFALLADIHANLPALQATLNEIDRLGVKDILVLGDVVGYGPHPNECVELLIKRNALVIRGNHDHVMVNGLPKTGFAQMARWAIEWSQPIVGERERAWLGTLPVFIRQDDWLAVHGSPCDSTFFNAYVYRMTYEENLDYLEQHKLHVCFHGHTHMPGVYCRHDGQQGLNSQERQTLASDGFYLICPGAVGQPRNRRAGADFAVFDREQQCLEFHHVDYDVESLIVEMQDKGFPDTLTMRLRLGN